MSYSQSLFNIINVNSLAFTSLDVNARVNFHFGNSAEFDPYIGIGLGYNSTSATWSSTDSNSIQTKVKGFIPLGAEFTVGARYYFSQHMGIWRSRLCPIHSTGRSCISAILEYHLS